MPDQTGQQEKVSLATLNKQLDSCREIFDFSFLKEKFEEEAFFLLVVIPEVFL